MRLVHWISLILALTVALAIAVLYALQPAAQVAVPAVGTVSLYLVMLLLAVLAYFAGWVYFLGYAWALSRERRAWRRERQRLEAELEKLRSSQLEEMPRIPDRPPPGEAEPS